MAIKKVWVEEDECTSCEACVDEAPDVFEMDDVAKVKSGIDLDALEDQIVNAADICPVECIKYE